MAWRGTAWPALQAPLNLNDDRVGQWSGGKKKVGEDHVFLFFFLSSSILTIHNTLFLLFFFAGYDRVGSCNPKTRPSSHSLTRTFPTLLYSVPALPSPHSHLPLKQDLGVALLPQLFHS